MIMNRLLNIGFIKVGHWTLENDRIQYYLTSHQNSTNILYSFISNDEVKYIGTTRIQLSKRMYQYQNPGGTQFTNIRINEKIKNSLLKDQTVDIIILVDEGKFKLGDFKINLAAGLEYTLIYETHPEWNLLGKRKIEENKRSYTEELIELNNSITMPNQTLNPIDITLGKTYYEKGFFNVPIQSSDLFGNHNAKIKIQLGSNPNNIIPGRIDRVSNKKGVPRIHGKDKLIEWIQGNFNEDDTMKVDILSKDSIRLNLNIL